MVGPGRFAFFIGVNRLPTAAFTRFQYGNGDPQFGLFITNEIGFACALFDSSAGLGALNTARV